MLVSYMADLLCKSGDLKGLKVFLEDKPECIKIIAVRGYWDKISGREHHLVVIRRTRAFCIFSF